MDILRNDQNKRDYSGFIGAFYIMLFLI